MTKMPIINIITRAVLIKQMQHLSGNLSQELYKIWLIKVSIQADVQFKVDKDLLK